MEPTLAQVQSKCQQLAEVINVPASNLENMWRAIEHSWHDCEPNPLPTGIYALLVEFEMLQLINLYLMAQDAQEIVKVIALNAYFLVQKKIVNNFKPLNAIFDEEAKIVDVAAVPLYCKALSKIWAQSELNYTMHDASDMVKMMLFFGPLSSLDDGADTNLLSSMHVSTIDVGRTGLTISVFPFAEAMRRLNAACAEKMESFKATIFAVAAAEAARVVSGADNIE